MTTEPDSSKSLGHSYHQHASVLWRLRYGLHQTATYSGFIWKEGRLAALEKCKGLLQNIVPMGEFAELAQTNTHPDDQSYTVSFPKLDKTETQFQLPLTGTELELSPNNIPNKVNQQVHSTPNAKLPKAKVAGISLPLTPLALSLKNCACHPLHPWVPRCEEQPPPSSALPHRRWPSASSLPYPQQQLQFHCLLPLWFSRWI